MIVARETHLDWIRHAAALAVFVGHARNMNEGTTASWAHFISEQAVNIFFIVSGFLILSSAERLSTTSFLVHRILRIFPALATVLLTTAFLLSPVSAVRTDGWWDLSSAFSYLVKNLTLVPAWQVTIGGSLTGMGGSESWNSPLWTLFFEVICYVGVLMVAKVLHEKAIPGLVLSSVGLVVAYTATHAENVALYHTAARLGLAFIVGSILGVDGHRVAKYLTVTICAIPAVVGEFFPLSIVLLAACVLTLPRQIGLSPPRIPGDISYGIYIWHWPVLQCVGVLFLGSRFEPGWVPTLVTAIGPLLLLATLSWVFIERPALDVARGFSGAGRMQGTRHVVGSHDQ